MYLSYRSLDPDVAAASQMQGSDPRYKVFISGPLPEHRAEFMTRGGHPVRKVLAGACKTFDLDFKRSALHLKCCYAI